MRLLVFTLLLSLPLWAQDAVNPCAVNTESYDCSSPGYDAVVELKKIKLNGKQDLTPTVAGGQDLEITVKLKYTKRGKATVTTTFSGSGGATCPDRIETKRVKPPVVVKYNATLTSGGSSTPYTGTGESFIIPASALTATVNTLSVYFYVDGTPVCVASSAPMAPVVFTITVDDGSYYGSIDAEDDTANDDTDYSDSKRRATFNEGDYLLKNEARKLKFTADFQTLSGGSASDSDISWSTVPSGVGSFTHGGTGKTVNWEQDDYVSSSVDDLIIRATAFGQYTQDFKLTIVGLDDMDVEIAPNQTQQFVVNPASIHPNNADITKLAALLAQPETVGHRDNGIRLRTRTYTGTSPFNSLQSESFVPSENNQWLGIGRVIERATYQVSGSDLKLEIESNGTEADYNVTWEIKRLFQSQRRFLNRVHVKVATPVTPPTLTLVENGTNDPGPLGVAPGGSVTLKATTDQSFGAGEPLWQVSGPTIAPAAGATTPTLTFNDAGIYTVTISDGGATASIDINVLGVDLDVDSDNSNGFASPDRSVAEDNIESGGPKRAAAGKVVGVGNYDTDGDGIPDYADGYNRDGISGNDDDRTSGTAFIPVVAEVPAPADPTMAKIRFTYSESTPSSMGGAPNYTPPGAGKMRLWRLDGKKERNGTSAASGGDFIPSGTAFIAADLDFGTSRRSRSQEFFIEAVQPSAAKGDIQLTIELDHDGDGTYEDTDTVDLTAVKVTINGKKYLGEDHTSNFTATAAPAGGTWEWDISRGGSKAEIVGADNTASVNVKGKNDSSIDRITLAASYTLDGAEITYPHRLTCVDAIFSADPGDTYGWDSRNVSPPWKSVETGQNDTVNLKWYTSNLPDPMHIFSNNVGNVSVVSPVAGNSPQTVTVTGVSENEAEIAARPGTADGPDAGKLRVVSYDVEVKRLLIIRMHEEDDDVQVIPYNQGLPNTTCITAGGDGTLETTPSGDDQIVGTTITTGANGICNTNAAATDTQVINKNNGKPNEICISAGANGARDTPTSSDDTVLGNDITTGPDGVCKTHADNTDDNNPTTLAAATFETYMDNIYRPAVVDWDVDEVVWTHNWDTDLSNDVTRNAGNNNVTTEMTDFTNAGAAAFPGYDHYLYLVQPFRQTNVSPGTTLGLSPTPSTWALIDGSVHGGTTNSVSQSSAHELGHSQGLPHINATDATDTSNLMYSEAGPTRLTLRKHQWDICNP